MLNINTLADSPAGTRFVALTPPPEKARYESSPASVEIAYEYYLEKSGNWSALTGQNREDYRCWLRNPVEDL